jgi:membrane-associated phospholipid phosphatase
MKRLFRSFVVVAIFAVPAVAQSSPQPFVTPTPTVTRKSSLEKDFIKNIFHDQKEIWTSPFKLQGEDAKWAIPLALGTGALIATDRYTSDWVTQGGDLPDWSHNVSWFGKAYVTGGVAAGMYAAGKAFHNEKLSETGLLAGESLVDTGIVTEVLKVTFRRERPSAGTERSEFFDGGTSFPSGHSSTVWSVATVVAYEYNKNPWIKYGSFAAATAVSLSRFSGRNHFLSDIVIGGAIGFGVGRFVYKEHHDPDLDQPLPKKTSWLKPMVVPFYDRGTVGGSVTWHL